MLLFHPMRQFLAILLFTVVMGFFRPLWAEDQAGRQFGVIRLSPEFFLFDPEKPEEFSKSYPLLPNPCPDYLPEKLYDVRKRFELLGVQFRRENFAWFNPFLQVLVLSTSPRDLAVIRSFVEPGFDGSPQNLLLNGEITVGGKSGARRRPSRRMAWEIYGKSGRKTTCSATGSEGIGYDLEISLATGPDGISFEYGMELKVRYGGMNYTLLSSATIPFSQVHTFLIGNTPAGERVEFHLSTKVIWLAPETTFMDGKWREGLLKCVRSVPQSAPR